MRRREVEIHEAAHTWPLEVRRAASSWICESLTGALRKRLFATCMVLGCGSGINDLVPLLVELRRRRIHDQIQVYGVDPSDALLEVAKARVRREARLACLDLNSELYRIHGPFDVVVAFSLIHRLSRWPDVANWMQRNAREAIFLNAFTGRHGLIHTLYGDGGGIAGRIMQRFRELCLIHGGNDARPASPEGGVEAALRDLGGRAARKRFLWEQHIPVREFLERIQNRAHGPFRAVPRELLPKIFDGLKEFQNLRKRLLFRDWICILRVTPPYRLSCKA